MKKKIALLLSMIVCILSLAACSNGEKEPLITEPHEKLDYTVNYLSALVASSAVDPQQLDVYDDMMIDEVESLTSFLQTQAQVKVEFPVLLKGMHSYNDSLEDLRYNELAQKVENNANPMQFFDAANITYDVSDDGVVAEAHFKTLEPENGGHDGIIEFIFDENLHVSSITVNTVLGLGESMKNAGVNTLIGMGTVFIMLIVIAIIISLLKYVPAIVDAFKAKPEEQNKESVEKAIENIVAREEADATEEETDDTELVAVIAAAIAASEGAASVDGFVVRSIRRIR